MLSEAEATLVKDLLPAARLITPNFPEAQKIAEILELPVYMDLDELAQAIACRLNGPAVLVKGGHLGEKQATDYLATPSGEQQVYSVPRIDTNNTHGTGCAYSALIAGFLARGLQISEAVQTAKTKLTSAIKNGYNVGGGAGTLNFMQ